MMWNSAGSDPRHNAKSLRQEFLLRRQGRRRSFHIPRDLALGRASQFHRLVRHGRHGEERKGQEGHERDDTEEAEAAALRRRRLLGHWWELDLWSDLGRRLRLLKVRRVT